MESNINKLLDQVIPSSLSFKDETRLVNISWVLIEQGGSVHEIYILNNPSSLSVNLNDLLIKEGEWMPAERGNAITFVIDGITTSYKRGFLNHAFMLLEKDDGTCHLFLNKGKLKDPENIPNFDDCLKYLAKYKKKSSNFLKVFSIIMLSFGSLGTLLSMLSYSSYGPRIDSYDFRGFIELMFIYFIGVPSILIGIILGIVYLTTMLSKNPQDI